MKIHDVIRSKRKENGADAGGACQVYWGIGSGGE